MRKTLPKPDYAAALEWGRAFVFERKSVVRLHELLAAASRRLLGTDVSMVRLAEESKQAGIVTAEDGERITSVDGLRREWAIVEHARRDRGQYRPFASNFDLSGTSLEVEQQRAVSHLLQSRDGVTLFRCAAGTGKTYALRELVARLESAGHEIRMAAPQAQQARALTADGIEVTVDPAVFQFILGEGFSELDGARPLERAIQNLINRPLVAAWTAGDAGRGCLTVNAARTGLEFGRPVYA